MLEHGWGRVVNVASVAGKVGAPYISAYTASKHGVIGLTRSLAVELGPTGVTVNCICPGPIHTGMTAAIPDEAKTKFARRRVPLRRYGDPEEVAMRENLWIALGPTPTACLQVLKDLECCLAVGWLKTT